MFAADFGFGTRSHFDPHLLSCSDKIIAPPHSVGALACVPSLQSLTSPEGHLRPIKDESPIIELSKVKNDKLIDKCTFIDKIID